MELPQDVLGLVRDFSRPLLPFVTEFKRTIRKLARGPDMDILYHDIQNRLYAVDGEQVIQAFMAYAAAVVATQRAMTLPNRGPDYMQSVAKNTETQTECFQHLRILVYN